MKTLNTENAAQIVAIARDEAGKADFITLLLHDEHLKLNDAGDIAIPSRTKCSIALEMHLSDETLINIINGFVGAART
jgi:hypothetical protein